MKNIERKIHERNIEIIDDTMVEIFKNKTPQDRLLIAFNMWASAKKMLTNYLRTSNPDWNDEKIRREVIKRLSHGNA